jgi:hypothetical protein
MSGQTIAILIIVLTVFVSLHEMDIKRIRLRNQVLAAAQPGTQIYQRNLPQKTTWHDADHAVADAWSARVLGAWWVWRTFPLLILIGLLPWISQAFGHQLGLECLGGLAAPWLWMGAALRHVQSDVSSLKSGRMT